MKRIAKHVIAALASATLICVSGIWLDAGLSRAEEIPSDIRYDLSEDGTLTISGNGAVTDGQELEKYQSLTKKLVISEGITDVQDVGLSWFEKLEIVKLPSTVTVIREKVFMGCKSLKEIDLGGAVTIGTSAFKYCESLKKLTHTDRVEKIGRDAFALCDSLQRLPFGNRLKVIGRAAFFDCDSLKNVVIPDSVTTIYRHAFMMCDDLETLVLPASLKSWRKSVLRGSPRVKRIVNRSRISCELEDCDGYKIWSVDGRPASQVPAKKTAVARGKKVKINYHLGGGKPTGKLPKYIEYGTTLRIPTKAKVKKKGYTFFNWYYDDEAAQEKDEDYGMGLDGTIGPAARTPEVFAEWFQYTVRNTKNGTVELKISSKYYAKYNVRCSEYKSMKKAEERPISGRPAKTVFRNLKKGKTYYFEVSPEEDFADSDDYDPWWRGKRKVKITK